MGRFSTLMQLLALKNDVIDFPSIYLCILILLYAVFSILNIKVRWRKIFYFIFFNDIHNHADSKIVFIYLLHVFQRDFFPFFIRSDKTVFDFRRDSFTRCNRDSFTRCNKLKLVFIWISREFIKESLFQYFNYVLPRWVILFCFF